MKANGIKGTCHMVKKPKQMVVAIKAIGIKATMTAEVLKPGQTVVSTMGNSKIP